MVSDFDNFALDYALLHRTNVYRALV
jgi:hypothetical protein